MHWEVSKFKQAVLTYISPVSSVGVTDNNIIYINPTMILVADMNRLNMFCFIRYAYVLARCAHANTVI